MINKKFLNGLNRRPQLRVTGGAHAGAASELAYSGCRIGSADDDDIVLSDAGVVAHHLTIRTYGQRVAVEASGGEIQLNGARLESKTGMRTSLPVDIRIGQAALRLESEARFELPSAMVAKIKRAGSITGAVAVFGIIALSSTLDAQSALAHIAAPIFHAADSKDNAAKAAQSAKKERLAARNEAVRNLRDRIDQANLSGVTVAVDGANVRASGHITTADQSKWTQIHQWFDGHYGNRVMLVSSVKANPVRPPNVHFSAIWLGEHPYVVDKNGRRRYPGSAIGDGWVVASIQSDAVTIRRGDRRYTYRF
ncbi:SctD/MshK family protein [Salinisphaera sp.]|uniref:SctD/MshK family protein n=1 Tax=Salinisphaera sp. TaxID=1914330 RepID=UPI002D77CB3B|nr:FHA domain-containing protein [Salinisphaera sp.]HET7314023.1 FHA domain-containing protein [Salinisphaera sp.]